MATYHELKLTHRLFMQGYPFARYALTPTPCAPLVKPPGQARVALVTSAGLRLAEQPAFDHSLKMGDPSFREIPGDIKTADLREDHKSSSFDHTGLRRDPNLAFPLDRFRELAAQGELGTLNHRHLSFMGSIIGPGRLINETAPAAARLLKEDGVDVAFLTPV